ncbi:hypothetical protein [Roseicella aquatilis]|uniref:Lipoprotein n=1 Tax=Roseicella aquatilis TaxID=2527868 RepID=A0A4R4DQP0_9PROT|nr:hypothetical protein [Roseicella aquatilis]TCZ64444.1 hypothetical protein EXY23_07300 [Roseicella aquatilis]
MGLRFVLAAAAPLVLAGCGNATNQRLPLACPKPGILAEGADLTRYRPGQVRDLTTLEWDARLAGVGGGCNPGSKNRSIDVQLSARFTVERGVRAEGRSVDLPWFVAVVDNTTEQVLSRKSFVDTVSFAPNEVRTTAESEPVKLSLPVGENRRGTDYRIYISFELTPEDLALNRRRGPR